MRRLKRRVACCVSVLLLFLPCLIMLTYSGVGTLPARCVPARCILQHRRSAGCAAGNTAVGHGPNVLPAMQVKEKVAAGQVPMAKYIITKQLTKRPEDYPDAKNQPHVQVALRRKAAGARNGVMQVCPGRVSVCWSVWACGRIVRPGPPRVCCTTVHALIEDSQLLHLK